jgi:hypothetical protein
MLRRFVLAATCTVPVVVAVDNEYEGFYHFRNWGGSVKTFARMSMPDGSNWDIDLAKDICSKDSVCTNFNPLGFFQALVEDNDYDGYLAFNTSVASAAFCKFESGGLYVPDQHYLHCGNDFGCDVSGHIINTYALPPDVIHTTCLSNPKCIGFRVKNDESSGDVFGVSTVIAPCSAPEDPGWFATHAIATPYGPGTK